jgi:hypothetical protein
MRSRWFVLVVLAGLQACTVAGVPNAGTGGTGGNAPSGSGGRAGTSSQACKGLECNKTTCTNGPCTQKPCAAGQSTTVSGVVYDPAGTVPLYNVTVYVPNLPVQPLKPIVEGVTCDRCQTSVTGSVASALTDAGGAFRLSNVPVGTNVPLVIEVGKWRREIKLPTVTACDNTMLADKNLTRLPRNQGEGHIPRIALTTGGADALECLLRKIGIEDSEFTPESRSGRVNLFAGGNHLGFAESDTSAGAAGYTSTLNGGDPFTDAEDWWKIVDNLKKYDIVLHSCDGESEPMNKGPEAVAALQAYANVGGRVFLSHWHNSWLRDAAPPLSTVGFFDSTEDIAEMFVSTIDTGFPKGLALADWLVNVGASTMRGQLPIVGGRHTVRTINPMVAQRWIYLDKTDTIQYLTANTPVGAAATAQCGRVVFTDLHVSSGLRRDGIDDKSTPFTPFPTGCVSKDLSPQEKALEFMLFDLSSCIRGDDVPPIVE